MTRTTRSPRKTAAELAVAASPEEAPARRPTKAARLRDMLDAPGGVTLAALSAALGWQPHTTRAALSRLKPAVTIERLSMDGETRYRAVTRGESGSAGTEGESVGAGAGSSAVPGVEDAA